MESVDFSGVEIIEEHAFQECKRIKQLVLPKLQKTHRWSFFCCYSLNSIDAPNLEEIGVCAFADCKRLKSATFPKVKKIENRAFSACEELTEINCPLAKLQFNEKGRYDQFIGCLKLTRIVLHETVNQKLILKEEQKKKQSQGCYVATAVYGSYNCPQVWTLRRYRDNTLAQSWYGRVFIHTYYAISPTLVKWFGHTKWFKKLWQGALDRMVAKLQSNGFESTPYEDKNW